MLHLAHTPIVASIYKSCSEIDRYQLLLLSFKNKAGRNKGRPNNGGGVYGRVLCTKGHLADELDILFAPACSSPGDLQPITPA